MDCCAEPLRVNELKRIIRSYSFIRLAQQSVVSPPL